MKFVSTEEDINNGEKELASISIAGNPKPQIENGILPYVVGGVLIVLLFSSMYCRFGARGFATVTPPASATAVTVVETQPVTVGAPLEDVDEHNARVIADILQREALLNNCVTPPSTPMGPLRGSMRRNKIRDQLKKQEESAIEIDSDLL